MNTAVDFNLEENTPEFQQILFTGLDLWLKDSATKMYLESQSTPEVALAIARVADHMGLPSEIQILTRHSIDPETGSRTPEEIYKCLANINGVPWDTLGVYDKDSWDIILEGTTDESGFVREFDMISCPFIHQRPFKTEYNLQKITARMGSFFSIPWTRAIHLDLEQYLTKRALLCQPDH